MHLTLEVETHLLCGPVWLFSAGFLEDALVRNHIYLGLFYLFWGFLDIFVVWANPCACHFSWLSGVLPPSHAECRLFLGVGTGVVLVVCLL